MEENEVFILSFYGKKKLRIFKVFGKEMFVISSDLICL